jgi:hypothetical protein
VANYHGRHKYFLEEQMKLSSFLFLAILSINLKAQADNTQLQIIKDDHSRTVLEQTQNGNLWITVTDQVAKSLYESTKAKDVKTEAYPGLNGDISKFTTKSVGNWFCTRYDDRGAINATIRLLTFQSGSRIKGFYYSCMGPVLE